MTERWDKAAREGYTHVVSFVLGKDDPALPWRQIFFKNRKDAQQHEKQILRLGGRAILSGMSPQFPRGK